MSVRSDPAVVPAVGASVPKAGLRERGSSPWLGGDGETSPSFELYQQLEREIGNWLPLPDAAVAPATMLGAFTDWYVHLMASPAKQWELAQYGLEQCVRAWQAGLGESPALHPLPQDKRFEDPAWRAAPHHALAQAFVLQQQWWQRATTGVPGVTRHHEQMVSFAARQWLDMLAPSNFIATNPVVQQRTLQQAGMNLLRGAGHALQDAWHDALDLPPPGAEVFEVGRNIAVTPGRVVLRNRLIELIQYAPSTPTVHAQPVLIVPAWIMKYYVLDLSPHNSLIKHLVDQGFTVFAISWKNPDATDRDLGMQDYVQLGVRAALQAVQHIVPRRQVHAVGYCLGGTLLAIVAAALGRDGDAALKSITLLAAQTDFTDPGELALFIDEGQVSYLENLMWRSGYLDKRQMKSTFQMLRSNDLVWSHRLHQLLLGERAPVSELMAWNADGTRMPYRMHSEYLRGLFLHNGLAHGEWRCDDAPVNLGDIHVPIFNVGAVQDHVAPWRSVFKLHALTDAEQTFVLTAGGHNVGIVNPPGQPRSSYRLRRWQAGERLLTPDEWLQVAPVVAGSWWTAWVAWLERQGPRRIAPPPMGAPAAGLPPLEAAPGRYVHQR
ncbi:MAG TPA: alpha/beta fold hydrolase [Rubrivivax sp.]|nr:alpha/beta fold hydrolase [Rubrivivax sp.]